MIEAIAAAAVVSFLPLVVVAGLGALAYAVVGERVESVVGGIVLIETAFLLVAGGSLALGGDVTLHFEGLGPVELLLALALVPVPFGLALVTKRLAAALDAEGESSLEISRESLPATVVLALVLVGPAEELLYRGVVQGILVGPLGTGPGIAVMAALFGAVHYPSYGADSPLDVDRGVAIGCLGTGIGGALFGALYVVTGSLLAPVVTHSLYDAVLFVRVAESSGEARDRAVAQ
jgi:membrane protease YdiL (CAAX protease family)